MSDKSPTSRLFEGSFIIFIGKFLSMGISFLGSMIIARFLGASGFGAISLGTMLMSTLTTISLFGTDTGIARYFSRGDSLEYKRSVLQTSLILSLSVGVLIGAFVYTRSVAVSDIIFSAPDISHVIEIFALAVPLSVLQKLFTSAIRSLKRPLINVYVNNIIVPVSKFSLIFIAIFFALGEWGVSLSYLVSTTVGAMLLSYIVIKEIDFGLSNESDFNMASYFRYSAPLMLTSLMTIGFVNIDRIFISQFTSTELVGVYSATYNLTNLMLIVMTSVNFLFLPLFSELHSDERKRQMVTLYEVTTKWIIAFSLPILVTFVVFSSTIITFTYGSAFLMGETTLIVLTLGVATHIFSGLNRSALKAVGKSKKVTYGTGAVFILNITLNLILVPQYSIVGAAAATAGSYLLWNIYYLYLLKNDLGIEVVRWDMMRPFLISGIGIGVTAYIIKTLLGDGLVAVFLFILFAGVGYLVFILTEILTQSDIEILLEVNESMSIDVSPIIRYVQKFV